MLRVKLSRHNIFIISGFATALVILVVVAVVSLHTIRDFIDGSRWVSHTQNVLTSLQETHSLLKDVESGQRGFLITGDEGYLELYQKAAEAIPGRLADFKLLTQDNPGQHQALANLESLINRRLTILADGIQLKETKQAKPVW